MAVRGVDDHDVDTGGEQRFGALQLGAAGTRCGGDAEPAVLVLAGKGMQLRLFDVLDRDEAGTAIFAVDDQQFFDAMLVQEALCFIARSRLVHRDEIVFRHQLGDGLVRVVGEAHIAVGQDAAEPAGLIGIGAALDDGNAGNLVVGHQAQRVGQGLVGMDRHRVHDHPGLELLDLADLGLLLLDRHVAVDDAETAGLRHRDRERAFGHRVHGGRDQRDAKLDLAGDAGAGVGLGREHARGGRNEHDVVKRQRLLDFHRPYYTLCGLVANM